MSHLPSSQNISGPAGTKAYTHAVQLARFNKAMDAARKEVGRQRKLKKARRLIKLRHASRRAQWA